MAQLFVSPFLPAFSALGAIAPGATLTFYASGTSDLADVWADDEMSDALANPLAANSAGRFPPIYLDPETIYRVVLKNAAGAVIDEADPVNSAGGFERDGGVQRSVQAKLRDRFDLRDFGVRNRFAATNDYTAEINAALAQAKSEGITTVWCEESYRVGGTIAQPASVGIVSGSGVSPWFPGSPAGESTGPGFYKPADGLDGPLLIRGVGAHMIGIQLQHEKIGGATEAMGGIMRMGPLTVAQHTHTLTMNCHILGHELDQATGKRRGTVNANGMFGAGVGTDCHGIVFPAGGIGFQRYWHTFTNTYVQRLRVGFKLNDQANAIAVYGLRMESVWRPVWLKGGPNECIENIFDGIWAQNYWLPTTTLTAAEVGALSELDRRAALTDAALFTLEDSCGLNQFRGPTEAGMRLWYVSSASAARFNDASGIINNEAIPSQNPPGWALPISIENTKRQWGGKRVKVIPLGTEVDNNSQGHGARIEIDHVQLTGLPLMNGAAGAPTTGAASRVMAAWTLPETISKAAAPHVRLCSRFVVHAPGGGAGSHSTEIEWEYRVSDNAPVAGELSVISVRQFPSSGNYLVGCHLITGETGGSRPFAIALTLGNLSAIPPTQISQSHLGKLESTNATPRPLDEFGDIDFVPRALTANDVTDAVTMLATGVTAI